MAWEMGEETRQVQGLWDVSTYQYKIEGYGLQVLTEGMKEKKFRGLKCSKCDTVYVPGSTFCRKCLCDIDEIVEVEDTGEVMSFAVEMADVRGNPLEEPRITAMIRLDGADSWIVGVVEEIDWHDMKVGMKVKAVWVDEPQGTLADVARFIPV